MDAVQQMEKAANSIARTAICETAATAWGLWSIGVGLCAIAEAIKEKTDVGGKEV